MNLPNGAGMAIKKARGSNTSPFYKKKCKKSLAFITTLRPKADHAIIACFFNHRAEGCFHIFMWKCSQMHDIPLFGMHLNQPSFILFFFFITNKGLVSIARPSGMFGMAVANRQSFQTLKTNIISALWYPPKTKRQCAFC